jgi:hypothetical protein
MSGYYESYEDPIQDDKPVNVLCAIAVNFQSFLSCALQSMDEHLKLIVKFSLLLGNFLEFVSAYQLQDSITINNSYKWFAHIWKILG